MAVTAHTLRSAVILLWAGWIAYTCFKRAIRPPKDRVSFWRKEVEAVNRNPIIRVINVLAGVLILLIGIGVVLNW